MNNKAYRQCSSCFDVYLPDDDDLVQTNKGLECFECRTTVHEGFECVCGSREHNFIVIGSPDDLTDVCPEVWEEKEWQRLRRLYGGR